jgi:hypothetical protein
MASVPRQFGRVRIEDWNSSNDQDKGEAINLFRAEGFERLGYVSGWVYLDDPKRPAFAFARYKFVAKVLQGCAHALEVGCGNVFFSRVLHRPRRSRSGGRWCIFGIRFRANQLSRSPHEQSHFGGSASSNCCYPTSREGCLGNAFKNSPCELC